MNEEQAKQEYINIIKEVNRKCDIIEKEAKKKGNWKSGLDTNRDLFKAVDDEAKRKIELLKSMVDNR